MPPVTLGILPWSQGSDWPGMLETARRVDRLGYDRLWTWDHLYAIMGDPYQDIFEGWMCLAAWAASTEHVRLGLMVGANTFRNPGLVAKLAATLDHISGGRAILGLGGAWFELEHEAHGIEFGAGDGQRLGWLHESVGIVRRVLDGEEVTHAGPRYRTDRLVHHPRPVQARLPILVGGMGLRKTLRIVARYADAWNAGGTVDEVRVACDALDRHCADLGRDPASIERTMNAMITIRDTEDEARRAWARLLERNRTPYWEDASVWLGSPERVAERMLAYRDLGTTGFYNEMPAPYDAETIERLIGDVRPLVEAAP